VAGPSRWRFWPERPPGPVDDAYVQSRWVRPYRPGPFRVAFCLTVLTLLTYLTVGGLLAILGSPGYADLAARSAIAAATFALLVLAFTRGFLGGVWVTDYGIRVLRPFSTRAWPWSEVADIRSVPGAAKLLGTPLRVRGHTVVVVLRDGSDVETPITDRSPDFLGRAEAFDMASGAVEGWLVQSHRRRHPVTARPELSEPRRAVAPSRSDKSAVGGRVGAVDDGRPLRDRLLRWVDDYETAWRTAGTALLAELFTPDAVYRLSPYGPEHVGLDAIAQMWETERDGPDEVFALTREVVAAEGSTGVVRCIVRYGEPVEQEYTDLWVVDLADDGRCRWFEEWPFWPGSPHTAWPS